MPYFESALCNVGFWILLSPSIDGMSFACIIRIPQNVPCSRNHMAATTRNCTIFKWNEQINKYSMKHSYSKMWWAIIYVYGISFVPTILV